MTRLLAWVEFRMHMIDRYLAECRNDKEAAAEAYNLAVRVKNRVQLESINFI